MFSKSRDEMKKPANNTSQTPRSGMAPTPSIIGSDVEIEGNVKTVGELQLDGMIIGDLTCGGLVMGDTGSVKGIVTAESVTIRGQVQGEIHANTVRLEKSAVIDGNVFHESLSVEAGAKLTGHFAHTTATKEMPQPIVEKPTLVETS